MYEQEKWNKKKPWSGDWAGYSPLVPNVVVLRCQIVRQCVHVWDVSGANGHFIHLWNNNYAGQMPRSRFQSGSQASCEPREQGLWIWACLTRLWQDAMSATKHLERSMTAQRTGFADENFDSPCQIQLWLYQMNQVPRNGISRISGFSLCQVWSS